MSITYYAANKNSMIVAVETGMPEHAACVGMGWTVREARASLSPTPIQSAGRLGEAEATALRWAYGAGQVIDIEPSELHEINVDDGDDDLTAKAWSFT